MEHDEQEEPEFTFHYKKGSFRRLEDKKYSDLATGKTGPAKGIFKVLFATKGNRLMFFTLVACAALVFVVNILSGGTDRATVGKVSCELSSFSFEGKAYSSVTLRKSRKAPDDSPTRLDIAFEAVNSDGEIADRYETSVVFNPLDEKPVHCIFSDYELVQMKCRITSAEAETVLEAVILKK